jgi:hypothetical protein
MSQTDVERIKEMLEEAKLRLRDLTRELDESMRAENEEQVLNELQRARDRVVALEHSLTLLEGNGQEPIAGN